MSETSDNFKFYGLVTAALAVFIGFWVWFSILIRQDDDPCHGDAPWQLLESCSRNLSSYQLPMSWEEAIVLGFMTTVMAIILLVAALLGFLWFGGQL
jgi:hypothetical protein